MKVGVVGVGRVGAACTLSLVARGSAREVVIVDRTRARARAVASDLRYGAPLCPEVALRDGDYADLASADLVMLTAGVNEKSGATDRNVRSMTSAKTSSAMSANDEPWARAPRSFVKRRSGLTDP
jgi:L-lactate dehydrogenase